MVYQNHSTSWMSVMLLVCMMLLVSCAAQDTEETSFGDILVTYARQAAEGKDPEMPKELELEGVWEVGISVYKQGSVVSQARADGEPLHLPLKEAAEQIEPGLDGQGVSLQPNALLGFHLARQDRQQIAQQAENRVETVTARRLRRGEQLLLC